MGFKKNREIKVYGMSIACPGSNSFYSGTRYKYVPQIRLQGDWLKELGFDEGSPINVECQAGKLIITLQNKCIVEE